MSLSNSDIESYIEALERDARNIKDDIFRLAWHMRGGVTSQELFHIYSKEDRQIIDEIIRDNVELTKKTGMPFL